MDVVQNLDAGVETGGGTDKMGGGKAQTWFAAGSPGSRMHFCSRARHTVL